MRGRAYGVRVDYVSARERAAEVPSARTGIGARGDYRDRARGGLRRPRVGRGDAPGDHDLADGGLGLEAPALAREPAGVPALRPAHRAGRKRLPSLRASPGRPRGLMPGGALRNVAVAAALAGALGAASCGGGNSTTATGPPVTVSVSTSTAPTASTSTTTSTQRGGNGSGGVTPPSTSTTTTSSGGSSGGTGAGSSGGSGSSGGGSSGGTGSSGGGSGSTPTNPGDAYNQYCQAHPGACD